MKNNVKCKDCEKLKKALIISQNALESLQTKYRDVLKEKEKVEKEKELDNIFWKQECQSLQKTLEKTQKKLDTYECSPAKELRLIFLKHQLESLAGQESDTFNYGTSSDWDDLMFRQRIIMEQIKKLENGDKANE